MVNFIIFNVFFSHNIAVDGSVENNSNIVNIVDKMVTRFGIGLHRPVEFLLSRLPILTGIMTENW